MKEELLIKQTKQPIIKQYLIEQFSSMGITKGDIVLVHSSLSSLGWVVGKEITVIQALLEVVGKEGTIVMPSQSGDWSNPDGWCNPPVPDDWKQIIKDHIPDYDPLTTPTRMMGRIADAFWHYPGSIRSNHPTVSFSANGKDAKELMQDHSLNFGLGDDGPLGKLYQKKAKILLIGVGYGNCTAIHLAESRLLKMNPVIQASRINGKWQEYYDIDYDDSDFEKVGEAFEKEYNVVTQKVGNATCKLIDLYSIVNFGMKWLKENRQI